MFQGWAGPGSANWDNPSFHTNRVLNLATSDPVAIEALMTRLFKRDLASSVELTEPFPERWSDHLLEIVADCLL